MLNEAAANASTPAGVFTAQALRNVDTYVHVVTTSAKASRYSQSQINEQVSPRHPSLASTSFTHTPQISVMNDAYAPLNVAFNLIDTDFTVNSAWAASGSGSSAELAMKRALHQGSYADLNLYFLSDLGGGLLGFCYFPGTSPPYLFIHISQPLTPHLESSPSSTDLILDGCVNLADSLPGGSATNYDEGATATHETGHWFGLYHVFQGSACSGSGDFVSDTPTSGCPASQDSCPNQAGVDSIHNWMDYSYDACSKSLELHPLFLPTSNIVPVYEFTSGQATRAGQLYDQLRAGK